MATTADFLALLPQFESVELPTIQSWLDEAAKTVDPAVWGDHADRAQILLAAHWMSMMGIGPEKGIASLAGFSSVRSGAFHFLRDTRVKDNDMGDFGLSSFGRLFWPIMLGISAGPRVTGSGEYPWPYGSGASIVNDPYAP